MILMLVLFAVGKFHLIALTKGHMKDLSRFFMCTVEVGVLRVAVAPL